MASKALHFTIAALGIAAASGAAWWYQNKPNNAQSVVGAAETSRGAAGAASGAMGPAGQGAGRPPAVEVARVEVLRLTDDAQAVGSLRSRQGVMVRPEVSGRITQINFRDGDRVSRGQLLVQLDDQLPLAQVRQAEAELSIAVANHKRNQELVAQNFISQRSVDESAANLQVAQAKLALAQATAARLRILAPFNGIAGIRSVNVGDYLKDGADIVNVEDIDAIYVDFRLPERYQTKLRRGQRAMVDIDALPGRRFSAVVQAIDPLVDANGRSIGVRGCVDNRQLALRPGMFARITAVFGEREDAHVVPEEAIVPQGGRQTVFKLVDGPDGDTRIARRVEVKVGLRRPGRVEVVEGLQPGDVVVTAGQQRIQRDGMPVRVVDVGRQAGQQGGQGSGAPMAKGGSGAGAAVAGAAAGSTAAQASKAGSSADAAGAAGAAAVAAPARAPQGADPCGMQAAAEGQPAGSRRGTGAPVRKS